MTEELQFKLFDKYDVSEIKIEDPALKQVINLEPKLIAKDMGRNTRRFDKTNIHIVERLKNKLATSGHRGKKHKVEKGEITGKYSKLMNIILETFEMLEKRAEKNPIQVLVTAIENASPRDEVTMIEYGGARYPQAVDVSPIRRINLALRWLTQGASDKAFNKKKTLAQGLADEIFMAYENSNESFAVKKKTESEKQADSAR